MLWFNLVLYWLWFPYRVSRWGFLKLFKALSLWRSCFGRILAALRLLCHHWLVHSATTELLGSFFLCQLLLFHTVSLPKPVWSFEGRWLQVWFYSLITSLVMTHPCPGTQGLSFNTKSIQGRHNHLRPFHSRAAGSKWAQMPTRMEPENCMFHVSWESHPTQSVLPHSDDSSAKLDDH